MTKARLRYALALLVAIPVIYASYTAFTTEVLAEGALLQRLIAVVTILAVVWPAWRFVDTGDSKYLVLQFLVATQAIYFPFGFLDPENNLSVRFMRADFRPENGVYIEIFFLLFIGFYMLGFSMSSTGEQTLATKQGLLKFDQLTSKIKTSTILLALGAIVLAGIFEVSDFLSGISGLAFFSRLLDVAFPMVFITLFFRPQPLPVWVLVGSLLYPLYYLTAISTGFIGPWLKTNMIILLGYGLIRRRMNWAILIVLIIGLIPLFLARHSYREQYAWTGYYSGRPLAGGLKCIEMALNAEDADVEKSEKRSVARIYMAPILFSHVIDTIESGRADYKWGSTLLALPLAFLPRVLFPWKSERTMGQDFGHEFGMLSAQDLSTSVNLPAVIESYINFGTFGVMIGFGLGYLCGWLSGQLGHARTSKSALLVGAVFSSLAQGESDISMMYGGVLQIWVFIWVFSKVFGSASRRSGESHEGGLNHSSLSPRQQHY